MRVLFILYVLLCALVHTSLTARAAESISFGVALNGTQEVAHHRCIFDEIQQRQALENFTSFVQIRPADDVTRTTGAPVSSAVYDWSTARSRLGEQAAISEDTSRVTVAVATPRSVTPRAGYGPIRISAFFADLDDDTHYCTAAGQSITNFQGGTQTCTETDILTDAKKKTLINEVVPAALQLHAERLMVETLSGSIVVPDLSYSTTCGSFTIPASHHTTGVSDTDMVVYVAAGPTSSGTVAWATSCSYAGSGRPAVGVINFSPTYISNSSDMERVLGHELLHAMGFSQGSFSSSGMLTTVASLRGKTNAPVINSPTVLSYTRAQYGCDTAPGMEIEDEGGSGTAGSHWKRRNAINEIMSGVSSIGYYSALTIAAMEDLGYYQGIYDKAEPLSWGAGVGCDFLDEKCVVDGVTKFPTMFCTEDEATGCAPDRRGLGYCRVISFASSLDKQYQYFSDPRKGGSASLVDYCPLYTTYTSSMCTETTGAPDYVPGAFFSASSRCLDGQYVKVKDFMGTRNGVCVNVECDAATSTYKVWFAGGREWVPCPIGTWIDPSVHSPSFTFGAVHCVDYGGVCGLTDQTTDVVGFNNAAASLAPRPKLWLLLGVLASALLLC